MSLPSKEEIHEKAEKLYIEEAVKKGLPPITPEESELKEGSYWERAKQQLMREPGRAEALEYLERMARDYGLRVVPERLAEKAEEPPIVERQLREEKAKRREVEKTLEARESEAHELERRVEVAMPVVEVAPPPIREPVAEGEMVIKKDCYPLFSRLWNEIKKGAAMEVGTVTVSQRTGLGSELINKALSYARVKQTDKIERLTDKLLECECFERRE